MTGVATTSGLATVWSMSALFLTMIIFIVYFSIFFMMLFGIFWGLTFIFRPLIQFLMYGNLD